MSQGRQEVPSLARQTKLIIEAGHTGSHTGHTGDIGEEPIGAQGALPDTFLPLLIGIVAIAADIDAVGILLIQVASEAGVALILAALQAQRSTFEGRHQKLRDVEVGGGRRRES